jgi:uncharacterized protein YggE
MRLVIIALSLALAGSAPLVAAAAMQSPVSTQPLAAGEVLLETNVLGSVSNRADYATMTVTIAAAGATEAEARAATGTRIREVRAALRALGVADAAITVRPVTTSPTPLPESSLEAAAMNVAMATENLAMDENATMVMDENATTAMVENSAIYDVRPEPAPAASGQARMEIVIRDVDRVTAVQQTLMEHGVYTGGVPVYMLADAAAARRQARAQAMQKARADAETYAASLDMRVVRIVRITERMGLDMLALLATEPNRLTRLFGGGGLPGPDIQTSVVVGVDFALAPR